MGPKDNRSTVTGKYQKIRKYNPPSNLSAAGRKRGMPRRVLIGDFPPILADNRPIFFYEMFRGRQLQDRKTEIKTGLPL